MSYACINEVFLSVYLEFAKFSEIIVPLWLRTKFGGRSVLPLSEGAASA